jgi:Tim17/Tim22/Tim23/Pmp24 family
VLQRSIREAHGSCNPIAQQSLLCTAARNYRSIIIMPASNRRPLYDDGEMPTAAGAAPAPSTQLQPAEAQAASAESTLSSATESPPFKQPCTIKGVASAAYAGALGYFLGFVPAAVRFRGKQWGVIHAQGAASASQLALMSGLYTTVHCIVSRLRLVEDGWSRGAAGCATGLALGWRGGPWSALQSCAGLGALSAVIDLGSTGDVGAVAAAAALPALEEQQQLPLPVLPQSGPRQQQLVDALQQLLLAVEAAAAMPSHLVQRSGGTAELLQQEQGLRLQEQPLLGSSRACQQQQQQQQRKRQQDRGARIHRQQEKREEEHQTRQLFDVLHRAGAAAQQLLLEAPPLTFLSACCCAADERGRSGLYDGSSGGPALVDACSLVAARGVERSMPRR